MPLILLCFGRSLFPRHKIWIGSFSFRKPFCSHPISYPWPSIFPLKASCLFPTQLLSRFLSLALWKSDYEEPIHVLQFQFCVDWFSDSVELPHLQMWEHISCYFSSSFSHFLSSANDLKVRLLLPTGPEAGGYLCLFYLFFRTDSISHSIFRFTNEVHCSHSVDGHEAFCLDYCIFQFWN